MTRAALVALQLEIDAEVLASPDAYRAHLEAECERALESAEHHSGLDEDDWDDDVTRLVVFPEVCGHLALYALAPPAARRAKTLAGALAASAVRRPLDVLRGVATTRLLDARHAVIAAVAPDAERWWKSVFGPLAKQHAAYIVAGSHLRLHPDGALTNSSMMFGPDGRLLATTDKVNLVTGFEDGSPGALALARGTPEVPIVETKLGKLVTLIGYDACRAPATKTERFVSLGARLVERGGVSIVANPSARRETADPLREALADTPYARFGVVAHLTGSVLDLSYAGRSEIVERQGSTVKVLGCAERPDRGCHVTALVTC